MGKGPVEFMSVFPSRILGDATSGGRYSHGPSPSRRGTFYQLNHFVSFNRHLPPPSYRQPRITVHALVTASRNAGGVSRHPVLVYTPTCRTVKNDACGGLHRSRRDTSNLYRRNMPLAPNMPHAQFMPPFYVFMSVTDFRGCN